MPYFEQTLFRQNGELNEFMDRLRQQAVNAVADVAPEAIRFSPEAVHADIVDKFSVQPVELHIDALTRSEIGETTTQIQGFDRDIHTVAADEIVITIPFAGEKELLLRRASQRTMGQTVKGSIATAPKAIEVVVTDRQLTAEKITTQVNRLTSDLMKQIGWANHDVDGWKRVLEKDVSDAIDQRKRRLDESAAVSASLAIPLTATPAELRVRVPMERKTLRIDQITSSANSGAQDPAIADVIYGDVIRTITEMGRAMERLPVTASKLKEEELRDLILFMLNANYQGAAKAEVFNNRGKTDIYVDWKGKNAFIGECKIWKGQKQFSEAIDQLFRYTSWRDTKGSLVLFIKTGEATDVIAKADKVLREHPSFRIAKEPSDPLARRDYLMESPTDSNVHVSVALIPVVIGVAPIVAKTEGSEE